MLDYCPPKSCSSLQKLSLNCCTLKIKGNVEWSRLKSLKIESSGVTQQAIDQVLRAMRSDGLLQPFSNVKFLSLNYDTCIHESLLRLLEFFLNLKTLVVKDYCGYCDSEVKFKPNPSNPFLAELETVEVTWLSRGRSFIFPFIKILLKHASKLEKLVFRVARTAASDVLLLASKELLGMRRSSPRAKMVFHEY